MPNRTADLDAAYGSERRARVAAFKQLLQTTAAASANLDADNYGPGVYRAGTVLRSLPPRLAELKKEMEANIAH